MTNQKVRLMTDGRIVLPFHKQETPFTCTPACARMVLEYYDRAVSEPELVRLLGTTSDGTLLGRMALLDAWGFDVEVRHGSIGGLKALVSLGFPCITPVHTMHLPRYPIPPCGAHCVVVMGVTEDDIYYHDPLQSVAPDRAGVEHFERAWQLRERRQVVIRPSPSRQT